MTRLYIMAQRTNRTQISMLALPLTAGLRGSGLTFPSFLKDKKRMIKRMPKSYMDDLRKHKHTYMVTLKNERELNMLRIKNMKHSF